VVLESEVRAARVGFRAARSSTCGWPRHG